MSRINRLISILVVVASCIGLTLSLAGCPEAGANSITSELLKPVGVTISGKVTSADTGTPIAGAQVRIQRLKGTAYDFLRENSADVSATTTADGSFAFAKSLSLDVDNYQYFLYVSDPAGGFYDNGSISVYAMRDSALAYPGMKLVSKAVTSYTVTISGKVANLQSSIPVGGALVRVQRLKSNAYDFLQENSVDVSATTAADGSFAFAKALTLDMSSYQYFLHVSDPAGGYYDNASTTIYVLRETALSYAELKLVSKAATTYTVVSGTVKDLLGGAVEGLAVKLYRKGETIASFAATTAATGAFSIPSVPATLYSLELDGSSLATPYIKEASDIVLANALSNPLGDLLVSKASAGDDLRIVLSWTGANLDLDASFSLPVASFDFNHLGTRQVRLPSSIISVNPAFKFAEATAYWPENMGGAADAGNRVNVNKGKLSHSVSSQSVVLLDKDSTDAATPEVTTIYKRNPLSTYPSQLAYHYLFTRGGTPYDYYPIGMGVFNVTCATANGSIYDSGATVKVYQGSSYLGKFSVADLAIDQGESNRRYWPVLQVEIGFTKPNPASADDIYYRVVPYGSAGALPSSRFAGYFYQETKLPGNETFTVLLDKVSYSRDYFLAPPPYPERVLASASGKIFSYDLNGGLSWKAKTAAPISSRPFIAGFYWGAIADTLYLAQASSAANSPIATAAASSSLDTVMTDAGFTAGVNVHDSGLVRFQPDQTFLLLATDKGPRGASSVFFPAWHEEVPKLDGPFGGWTLGGWTDNTTGAVLSAVTPRQLTRVLPMRDRYGAIGRYALIGGQGLFLFNAAYAKFDGTDPANGWTTVNATKADFRDIVNADGGQTCNLSGIGSIVTAMAEVPPTSASYTFVVALREGAGLTPRLYSIGLNESGGANTMPGSPHIFALPDPGFGINDLRFVQVAREWVLLAATDSGLRLNRSWSSGSWEDYLPDMLGGYKITKLFDYDGKLGILAEGNGLMYGPYPQ